MVNYFQEFLKKYPDVKFVDILLCDINGVARGFRSKTEYFNKIIEKNFFFCLSAYYTDIFGSTIYDKKGFFEKKDPDILHEVISETLVYCDWEKTNGAQVIMNSPSQNVIPRNVLSNVVQKLEKCGLSAKAAVEYEFYLLDKEKFHCKEIAAPELLSQIQGNDSVQVYAVNDFFVLDNFLKDISETAQKQNLPLEKISSEHSLGQLEINLCYRENVVKACDDAFYLKRLIKAIANKHNMIACFMAKPYIEKSGNGSHVHLSLFNKRGENALLDNDSFQSVIGGLLATMPDNQLIFTPHINSLRRLSDDPLSFSPSTLSWGHNNRSVALRIPPSDKNNKRIEHRVAGADTNPYLVVAAVLAGVVEGITRKLPSPQETKGLALENAELPRLKKDWYQVIQEFQNSSINKKYYGEAFCSIFTQNMWNEWQKYQQYIPPIEFEWYTKIV